MEKIVVSLSDEELSQIYGGIVVEKPITVENNNYLLHLNSTDGLKIHGKDDPGGNGSIFTKAK